MVRGASKPLLSSTSFTGKNERQTAGNSNIATLRKCCSPDSRTVVPVAISRRNARKSTGSLKQSFQQHCSSQPSDPKYSGHPGSAEDSMSGSQIQVTGSAVDRFPRMPRDPPCYSTGSRRSWIVERGSVPFQAIQYSTGVEFFRMSRARRTRLSSLVTRHRYSNPLQGGSTLARRQLTAMGKGQDTTR